MYRIFHGLAFFFTLLNYICYHLFSLLCLSLGVLFHFSIIPFFGLVCSDVFFGEFRIYGSQWIVNQLYILISPFNVIFQKHFVVSQNDYIFVYVMFTSCCQDFRFSISVTVSRTLIISAPWFLNFLKLTCSILGLSSFSFSHLVTLFLRTSSTSSLSFSFACFSALSSVLGYFSPYLIHLRGIQHHSCSLASFSTISFVGLRSAIWTSKQPVWCRRVGRPDFARSAAGFSLE